MELLTVAKAAELLKVNPKTVYRLIEGGSLPAFKVGRRWRMRLGDVEAWIEGQLKAREAGAPYQVKQAGLFDSVAQSDALRTERKAGFRDSAFSENNSLPIHRWVPWIAGFSAGFVEDVLRRFVPARLNGPYCVLDPFAGVGTTLVTAMLAGYDVYGFEINPYASQVCQLKLSVGRIDAVRLESAIARFTRTVTQAVESGRTPLSSPPHGFVTREGFFSPAIERKVLHVCDFIRSLDDDLIRKCFELALVSEFVGFSNYSYEPSLSTRTAAGRVPVRDAPVVGIVARKLSLMLHDIRTAQRRLQAMGRQPRAVFHAGDFFEGQAVMEPQSVDLVVTSPPYLNNYHYVRNSRPQAYWLDLVRSPEDLREVEERSFGKYWQTVRGGLEVPLEFHMPELEQAIAALRERNASKGQYGGPGWANYAATYFNDAFRFAQSLRHLLRPTGMAVVVLGNSILQGVEFKTDVLFGRICEVCGLRVTESHLLRAKRTGNSIIASTVRAGEPSVKTRLYETAVMVSPAGPEPSPA
jgi:excisionase family DNA binding protein